MLLFSDMIYKRCPRKLNGSTAATGRRMRGSEMRLTRRVLSPIIFSLSLSAASAQNLSVNGLEKSEAYLLSTYRNACEKGINGIHGTNCVFKFPDAVLAVFVGRGAQPDPLGRTKNGSCSPWSISTFAPSAAWKTRR